MKTKKKSSKLQGALVPAEDLLSDKQRIFCDEYLANGFHAYNAYIKAFGEGKSKGAASVSASKLLKMAKVARYLSQKRDELSNKTLSRAERLLQELEKIAFANAKSVFNSDGSVKQISEMDDDTTATIAAFEVCELFEGQGEQKHAFGLIKKAKQHDKIRAIELLGKYEAMWTDKKELTGPNGGPIEQNVSLNVVFVDGDE